MFTIQANLKKKSTADLWLILKTKVHIYASKGKEVWIVCHKAGDFKKITHCQLFIMMSDHKIK